MTFLEAAVLILLNHSGAVRKGEYDRWELL